MNRGSPSVTISAYEARRARKKGKNLSEPPAGSLRDLLFTLSADYRCRPAKGAPPTDTDDTAVFFQGNRFAVKYRRLLIAHSNGLEIRAKLVINVSGVSEVHTEPDLQP